MAGYQRTKLSDGTSYLALRLSDSGQRFFQLVELQNAVREALRIWNVLTSHDRARGLIQTPAASPPSFYQLSASLKDAGGNILRLQSITDAAIVSEINAHVMEDQKSTDMFTLAQTVDAVQWARDQFVADTGIVLTSRSDFVLGGSSGTFDFPDTVTGIRRAVYQTSVGRYITLTRSDERSATAFNRDWKTPGRPRTYAVAASPLLRCRIIPPPSESGFLNTYVTVAGAALDQTQVTPQILGIPDDLCWPIKWAAMATLFGSDGPGSDPDRADRAEKLYQLGVQLATKVPTILHAEIDGVPVVPTSISRTDLFNGGWEGGNTGQPKVLSIVGPDLIALTPPPDGQHSVTLDVVRNALVPSAAGDYLQIGREQLGAVLGMAQWLCVFKLGGDELRVADTYFNQFFEEAQHYAFQRSAASSALQSMQLVGTQQTKEQPFEIDPTEGVRNADEVRQERNARRRSTTQ